MKRAAYPIDSPSPSSKPKHANTQPKVLVSDPIEKDCIDILKQNDIHVDCVAKKTEDELVQIIKEYDGLIVRSGTTVTAKIIDAATKLRCIGRAGTGTDNIDCVAATRKGIVVCNTPGGNTVSAAEQSCALIAALARNVAQGDGSMKAGKWDRKKYMGVELDGKTLGVLGLGRVGREVASRMQAFNMNVVGYDPFFPAEAARKLDIEPASADEVIRAADFLTIHVPLLDETRNLINAKAFASMKPGARIVNCARGGIINEADLLAALESGHIAGAALDVFESEPPLEHEWALIKHPLVIATPHLGASTVEAQTKVAKEIATSMAAALYEKPVGGVVNAPDLTLAQSPDLKPWTALAEALGSLVAHLIVGQVRSLSIELTGAALAKAGSLCAAGCLVGLFRKATGHTVNLISAPAFAAEREIEVNHSVNTSHGMYTNLLKLTVEDVNGTHVIAGTTMGARQLRVVQLNEHHIEFSPRGYLLLYKSIDKPGVLSRVSGLVGSAGVNIISAAVSSANSENQIVNVFNIKQKMEPALIEETKALADVCDAHLIHI